MKYYSIRVVEADSANEAIEKVIDGDFIVTDELSDVVIPSICVSINVSNINNNLKKGKLI